MKQDQQGQALIQRKKTRRAAPAMDFEQTIIPGQIYQSWLQNASDIASRRGRKRKGNTAAHLIEFLDMKPFEDFHSGTGSQSLGFSIEKQREAVVNDEMPMEILMGELRANLMNNGDEVRSIPSSGSGHGMPSHHSEAHSVSLRIVRKTFEDCRTVRSILRGFRVPVDERDLSIDSRYLDELQRITGSKKVNLPVVFIGGKHIGGAKEIKEMNESGELRKLIGGLPFVENSSGCNLCGGLRFVLCEQCNGSHEIYSEKLGFRTCTSCNVNGMTMCGQCFRWTSDLDNRALNFTMRKRKRK
ncbi:hypothetical protein GH714_013636 [Hevea brasiliensis]|uniref:Glutaredoxin domain-containing protein n=1 Tax=Hevea brasiliensis TaxID=3981 RepID=A0A6A6N3G2_HEVBR|nr:hypothetical protein GH714_013636 [Hevea brasiliensis]